MRLLSQRYLAHFGYRRRSRRMHARAEAEDLSGGYAAGAELQCRNCGGLPRTRSRSGKATDGGCCSRE